MCPARAVEYILDPLYEWKLTPAHYKLESKLIYYKEIPSRTSMEKGMKTLVLLYGGTRITT